MLVQLLTDLTTGKSPLAWWTAALIVAGLAWALYELGTS